MTISNLVVRYRNEINKARHKLSTVEGRIILAAIAQVPSGEVSDQEIYWVSASDLIELGTSESKVYLQLKEASINLINRLITIPDLNENGVQSEIMFHWITSVRFPHKSGKIGIRFSPEIIPFITQIQTEFTKYNLVEIKGFNYLTCRMYSILAQYQDTGFYVVRFFDLKKLLDLGDKYPTYGSFKQRVLTPSLKAINESDTSRFKVSVKEKKVGRQVDRLMFSIRIKDENTFDLEEPKRKKGTTKDESSKSIKLTEAQIQMYADQLSGLNKNFEKVASAFYSEARKKGLLKWDGKSFKQSATDLANKLRDPDFVMEIYPWLERLGFKRK